MILGGSKYNAELSRLPKYLPLINELGRSGRTIRLQDAEVDEMAVRVRKQAGNPASLNDEHIIALVVLSRCRVVCTDDNVAITFLKSADLFRALDTKRPKIYKSSRNQDLCCNQNLL